MRRDAPKRWREVSPHEYLNASKRAQEALKAWHSASIDAAESQGLTSFPKVPSGLLSSSTHQGYDVRYFARKHGITLKQARKIIAEGGDRERLNVAAAMLKRLESSKTP